jgi:hypothetical protein
MITIKMKPTTAAERKLRSEAKTGEFIEIGDGARPAEAAGPDRRVRADFLRALILNRLAGCHVHDKGVRIAGAYITGVLDLAGCRIPRNISLHRCRFDAAPVLQSAEIDNLFLDDSALPGLRADRLTTRGSVHLHGEEAEVTGTLSLGGAKLGGDLSCSGATLRPQPDANGILQPALFADGLEASGDVFLNGTAVTGAVRLPGATLGGDLNLAGGRFTPAAQGDGRSLSLDRITVNGGFFLCGGARVEGALDLTGAALNTINDQAGSWPGKGDLRLDRCTYTAFTGSVVSAEDRIDWLDRQDPARWGADFWPQPWVQCARVLSDMGHREDARRLLIEKEARQRRARRERAAQHDAAARPHRPTWRDRAATGRRWLQRAGDAMLCWVAGYGHRPHRALYGLAGFWALGLVVFYAASWAEALKPNNAFILRSPEWAACAEDYERPDDAPPGRHEGQASRLACFADQPEAATYPVFNAGLYSLDTLLPVVEMEMQQYWIPDETAGWVGLIGRWYLWVHIIAGWAFSLFAVAGFSGLIKAEETE